MNKNALINELLKKGFTDAHGSYQKKFNGRNISLLVTSGLFGSITTLTMLYEFKNDLSEELHEEVMEKSKKLVDNLSQYLKIATVGNNFLEAEITGKAKKESVDSVIRECAIFADAIIPLLDEYNV